LPVSSYITTKFYNNLNFKKGLNTIHPFYWN
jgi:hypothetical protein